MSIVKSVTETGYTAAGQVLHYSYLVTNTGTASLKGPVTIDDDISADESCPDVDTVGDLDTFLDPGESITCTATYTTVAGDVTAAPYAVTNIASATVEGVTSPTDTVTVYYFGPTRVFLSDFRAFSEKGRVHVQWTTSSETDTAGFFLLRLDESRGMYNPINREALPAIFTAPQGGTYTLVDKGASPGKRHTYLLVELEVSGTRNTYGPFSVRVEGAGPQGAGLIQDAQLFSGYSRKAHPISGQKAARIQSGKAARAKAKAQLKGRTGVMAKIAVETSGLHYVDALEISSLLGIPLKSVEAMIKQGKLAMSSQGSDVAYSPAGDNSGLYFYARGLDSIYTRENIYWLYQGRGLQMKLTRGKGPSPVDTGAFTETTHDEKDLYPALVTDADPESDYWFWDYLYAVAGTTLEKKQFIVKAEGVSDQTADAGLTVFMQGITEARHRVIVRLNGNVLTPVVPGSDTWSGIKAHEIGYTFSQDLLDEGDNIVEIEGVPAEGELPSVIFVDSFDTRYQRLYQAAQNSLRLHGDGNTTVSAAGFTNADILVFDITDPDRPTLKTDTTISGTNGNYRVSFTPSSPETPYLACTADAASAGRSRAVNPSHLSATGNRADYVLITTEELAAAAETYAGYWQSRGFTTKVVIVDDIYDEFNAGIVNPKALRDFLGHAYRSWILPPRYVLLAGEGTYDYRDNLGHGESLVPVKMLATPLGLATSDNYYADLDGDHLPEMAIGRLPVATAQELDAMLGKLITYDPSQMNKTLLLADNPDNGGDFSSDSDDLSLEIPPHHPVERIYLSDYSLAAARRLLFDGFSGGALFINFTGHSAVDRFEDRGLLATRDVSSLTNSKLPIVTALSCVVGQFALPGYDSLSESLVTKQGGGAIAFFGATGMALNADSIELGKLFYQTIFADGATDLGSAVKMSFEKMKALHGDSYVMDAYNLQGDPALGLKR